jgi:hypothetical protein
MNWVMLDKRILDALMDWRADREADWDSGFLGLIGRWVPWFDAERIEYAFDDSTAIQLHGGDPDGQGASLLMTPASWEHACRTARPPIRARRAGLGSLGLDGGGYGSTVFFVDSLDGLRVSIHGVWVTSLAHLIGNALLRPRSWDREMVASLIRANGLDEAFAKSLSTRSRRTHYLACLAEVKRQAVAQ